MLGVDGMNFISASYNMYHNSIDITTFNSRSNITNQEVKKLQKNKFYFRLII